MLQAVLRAIGVGGPEFLTWLRSKSPTEFRTLDGFVQRVLHPLLQSELQRHLVEVQRRTPKRRRRPMFLSRRIVFLLGELCDTVADRKLIGEVIVSG